MREDIRNQEIGKVRGWRGMVEGLTPDADLRILTPAQQRARTKGFGPTKTTAAGHTIHQYHRAGPPSIKARHYVWGGGRLLDGFRHWVAPQDYFLPAGGARDDFVPVRRAVIRKHPLASDPNFSVAERAFFENLGEGDGCAAVVFFGLLVVLFLPRGIAEHVKILYGSAAIL